MHVYQIKWHDVMQVKTLGKCFENAKSVLKIMVILWEIFWSQTFEKVS